MTDRLMIQAPAKINLSLDITGKRPDGYHTLRSIFQTVGLYDTLSLRKTEPEAPMQLSCHDPEVPCDARNLIWKAAAALLGENPRGLSVHLEKRIPSQAGLGGGSSDCAAALRGIRELFSLSVSDAELHEIAARLGADVPFFLCGGTVLCEGIGEILTPLPALPEYSLVIAKGHEGVSTPEGYRRLDCLAEQPAPATDRVLQALHSDAETLFSACGNAFDAVTELAEVRLIRNVMRRYGIHPVLSGSGAAVFGGCRDAEQANLIAEALRKEGIPFASACKTV